jgi:hypothetical protein
MAAKRLDGRIIGLIDTATTILSAHKSFTTEKRTRDIFLCFRTFEGAILYNEVTEFAELCLDFCKRMSAKGSGKDDGMGG